MAEPLVVLVTGARKGIGRALAEHYLARGDTVVGMSREPSDLGRQVIATTAPTSATRAGCARRSPRIRRNLGRVSTASINNAGVAAMNHALLTPLETVTGSSTTNVAGTFLFCREAAKLMQRRRFGRIVNFARSPCRSGSTARRSTPPRRRRCGADPGARPRAGRIRNHGQRDRTDARGDGSDPRRSAGKIDRLLARQAIRALRRPSRTS